MSDIRIRCSSLPSYGDCGLWSASRIFIDAFKDMGMAPRPMQPSIGAIVGTAAHEANRHALTVKMETGTLAPTDECVDLAMENFKKEIKDGVVWDDTSPNAETASFQLQRIVKSYLVNVAPGIAKPILVEDNLKADIGDGFVFTGQPDVVEEITPGEVRVRDPKTGAVDRSYMAQIGGYSLLVRSHREAIGFNTISGLIQDWIPRTRKSKPQGKPRAIAYDVGRAEAMASAQIGRIKHDYEQFAETGEPLSFPANPLSMMCTPKYCGLHGTDICPAWRDKEN